MTRDGDPRQQARLGLWLAASLLLHAVAVPFLQTGTTSDGHAGEGLQVTLLGAAHESPASAAASAGPGTPSDGEPARQRSTGRQRESYPSPATTSVDASIEPRTATRVENAEADVSTSPAAVVARAEPAATRAQPGPGAVARVAPPEPLASKPPAAVVRIEPEATHAEPPPEQTTPARVEAAEPDASKPPATVVARIEPEATRAQPPPEQTAPARVEATGPDASEPPAAVVARIESEATLAQPPPEQTAPARVAATGPDTSEPPAAVVARTEPEATGAEPPPEATQPASGKAPQSAASDSETPEQTQDATDATTNAAASPTQASAAGASNASLDAGGERTLLALLHHAIDDRKRYPRLARRQRREGSATVLFRLHPDGALDGLELAASSGFDLLDRAALRAVAAVAPFAPATRYLTRDKQFSVEVEFRLF